MFLVLSSCLMADLAPRPVCSGDVVSTLVSCLKSVFLSCVRKIGRTVHGPPSLKAVSLPSTVGSLSLLVGICSASPAGVCPKCKGLAAVECVPYLCSHKKLWGMNIFNLVEFCLTFNCNSMCMGSFKILYQILGVVILLFEILF